VKKKILFVLLAAVLSISLGLVGCGGDGGDGDGIPPEPDFVTIGVSSPLDGPLAAIRAGALTPIIDTYIDWYVNNVTGGILLDEYGADFRVQVNVIEYNDSSNVDTMLENTEKLITEDEVDFVWGACGTGMISAQAPLVNSLDHVLLTFEGGATQMKDSLPGLPYVFVGLSFSDWYELPVLAKTLADAGATDAYIVWINDLHGIEYNGVAGIEFAAQNISIAKSVSISAVPAEAAAAAPGIISDAKSVDADVFCIFAYPDQIFPLTGQAMAQSFNPDAFVAGPGANFGFYPLFLEVPASAVEGVTCFATANNNTSPEMDWLFDEVLMPAVGFPFLDWWGHPLYWAQAEMWQAAVESVGYVDQDEVRDALAGFSETNPAETVLGDTWYTMFGNGGGILAYECHTGEIGQWNNGQVEIVGYANITDDLPNYVTTASFTYPKPAWPGP
jgi:ABC-type branched-subunit amino acid transport system substrate-binding protein